jgi:hypothetical protein
MKSWWPPPRSPSPGWRMRRSSAAGRAAQEAGQLGLLSTFSHFLFSTNNFSPCQLFYVITVNLLTAINLSHFPVITYCTKCTCIHLYIFSSAIFQSTCLFVKFSIFNLITHVFLLTIFHMYNFCMIFMFLSCQKVSWSTCQCLYLSILSLVTCQDLTFIPERF